MSSPPSRPGQHQQQRGNLILLTGVPLAMALHGHLPSWAVVVASSGWGLLLYVVFRVLRKRADRRRTTPR